MPVLTYCDPDGYAIAYAGGRLADITMPGDRYPVDCAQVRPWDFGRSPAEQEPATVDRATLAAALDCWRAAVDGTACPSCGVRLDRDCQSEPRCPSCDGPCPSCYAGDGPA